MIDQSKEQNRKENFNQESEQEKQEGSWAEKKEPALGQPEKSAESSPEEFLDSPDKSAQAKEVSSREGKEPGSLISSQGQKSMAFNLSEEKRQKLEEALETAFSKGLGEAIDQIKKTQDPYLIDAFHDTLVDKFYQKLIVSGKLKKL